MILGDLKQRVICALCVLALASCSGPAAIGGDPQLSVLPGTDLPTPSRADIDTNSSPYYVGPFDRLAIDVFGIEELSGREVQVDASGRMSFPLAGVVEVAGLTPSEVEAELVKRLAGAYVRNPQVTVNLKETLSRVVTVEGQVRKPGVYPIIGKVSLMGAIARAEGTDEFSRLDDVIIFRTVGGRRYAALYNLEAVRHGNYADPEIYAGDTVMVGESRGRRMFKDILSTVPLLTTPIIFAIDRLNNN